MIDEWKFRFFVEEEIKELEEEDEECKKGIKLWNSAWSARFWKD